MSRSAACALLLAGGLVALAAPVPKAKPKADPFPYTVGTKWEYVHDGDEKSVWVEEVVECDDKDGVVSFKVTITPSRGVKRWERYQLKGGVLELTATQNGEYDPPMLIAKAGMKDGDEWETKYGYKGNPGTVDTVLTVGKAEEIATPLGKITATPVTRTTKGFQGNAATTFWFADGYGMVRQTSPGTDAPPQDLKAFTPGKK